MVHDYMILSGKKERHLRQWKNEKVRVASGGIRTHDTLYVHVNVHVTIGCGQL